MELMGKGEVLTTTEEISNWYPNESESKDPGIIPRKEKYAVFTCKH